MWFMLGPNLLGDRNKQPVASVFMLHSQARIPDALLLLSPKCRSFQVSNIGSLSINHLALFLGHGIPLVRTEIHQACRFIVIHAFVQGKPMPHSDSKMLLYQNPSSASIGAKIHPPSENLPAWLRLHHVIFWDRRLSIQTRRLFDRTAFWSPVYRLPQCPSSMCFWTVFQ